MSDATDLIYLETDDEVTAVARRLRDAGAERAVLVAPGRSRAMSSVVALRLLGRVAGEADRALVVVGDSLTRSLATEAGLESFATVADARAADATAEGAGLTEPTSHRAAIRVLRGSDARETGVAPPPTSAAWSDAQTQVRPVAPKPRTPSRPVVASRRGSRAIPRAGLLLLAAALLLTAGVVGAAVLPSASVAVVPRAERLDSVTYQIEVDDPVRVRGEVTQTVPVVATGTYETLTPAEGTVVFRNFNVSDVAVAGGTLVAAGEQAFATAAEIVVPAGTLTPQGTIQAGEEGVLAVAAAAGPAANVEAGAVDTILTQNVAVRLRGFPNNAQRLVTNPEPTAGGADDAGSEVTQADVDDARAALLAALDSELADVLGATDDLIHADAEQAPEPMIEGLDGLVGTRDPEGAELRGTLAYDRLAADPDEIRERARDRFMSDDSVLPDGHQLVADLTTVELGTVQRDGDSLTVEAEVTGASTPAIDEREVIQRVRGRSVDEARSSLQDIGDATIALWPDWVSSVPDLDWRIDVGVVGTDASAAPSVQESGAP